MSAPCNNHRHGEDDHIMLMLVAPPDRAVALLTEIDERKASGEPAAVSVNVMDIVGFTTSGEGPPARPGTRTITGRASTDRGTYWPWAAVMVAIYLACGFAISTFDGWVLRVQVMVLTLSLAIQVLNRSGGIRWRRKTSVKAPESTDKAPPEKATIDGQ